MNDALKDAEERLVLQRPGEGDVPMTRAEWRSYWRSLPDYDGPPMRTPSGVIFEQVASGQLRVCAPRLHKTKRSWFRGANKPDGMVDPDLYFGGIAHLPIDAECVAARKRWSDEAVLSEGQLFARPAEGGRGWCPGLAGVGK